MAPCRIFPSHRLSSGAQNNFPLGSYGVLGCSIVEYICTGESGGGVCLHVGGSSERGSRTRSRNRKERLGFEKGWVGWQTATEKERG